jgi:hypothetical protein
VATISLFITSSLSVTQEMLACRLPVATTRTRREPLFRRDPTARALSQSRVACVEQPTQVDRAFLGVKFAFVHSLRKFNVLVTKALNNVPQLSRFSH